MSRALVPSTALLRTLSQPATRLCASCQTRSASSYMPRSKYAKLTRLDKLHRQQKAAVRDERKESELRAQALEISLLSQVETVAGEEKPSIAQSLPFHIGRTLTSNLPIYETSKAGESKRITLIRKLSGDLDAMQAQIRTLLQLPDFIKDNKGRKKDTVAINRTTNHIVVRGWRGAELKKWAEVMGF